MNLDLTYYYNPSLSLKNFLYFPEKNASNLSTPSRKQKKNYYIFLKKNFLYFGRDADKV